MVKKNDLEKLVKVSDMAKLFTDNEKCELVEIFNMGDIEEPEFSFHPNGKCGCIELNDDYLFGIRCNHLMWAEGSCEGVENCFEGLEESNDIEDYIKTINNTILFYGNHKGTFCMYLLVYYFGGIGDGELKKFFDSFNAQKRV